jgi:hypothetical protein
MTAPLSPAVLARLSAANRSAVEQCGGVDGAAVTTARGRSTCGRWINRNDADQPPLDAALAMDQVVALMGRMPPILTALARELGHVIVPLPDAAPRWADGRLLALVAAQAKEFGEISGSTIEALADGTISAAERARITGEIDDLLPLLIAMRGIVAGGEA